MTGAMLGTIGMVMGIAMGIGQDFTLAPAHAHLNLVGWVSLVLFGLAYRVELAKSGTLAAINYWLATAGAVTFPIGIYFAVVRDEPAIAIVGALLTLVSMLIFIINVWRAPRRALGGAGYHAPNNRVCETSHVQKKVPRMRAGQKLVSCRGGGAAHTEATPRLRGLLCSVFLSESSGRSPFAGLTVFPRRA